MGQVCGVGRGLRWKIKQNKSKFLALSMLGSKLFDIPSYRDLDFHLFLHLSVRQHLRPYCSGLFRSDIAFGRILVVICILRWLPGLGKVWSGSVFLFWVVILRKSQYGTAFVQCLLKQILNWESCNVSLFFLYRMLWFLCWFSQILVNCSAIEAKYMYNIYQNFTNLAQQLSLYQHRHNSWLGRNEIKE